jgi:hypothetical protein
VAPDWSADWLHREADVELAGAKTGLELAQFAQHMFPRLKIVVVSGTKRAVPRGMTFLEKPLESS